MVSCVSPMLSYLRANTVVRFSLGLNGAAVPQHTMGNRSQGMRAMRRGPSSSILYILTPKSCALPVPAASPEQQLSSAQSLFLMSFSSFRIREDSCSGVGALSESEPLFSTPEGGAGRRWRKSSSMLLCSLLFRPCHSKGKQ